MPQPIDRIVPKPHVYLDTDILKDKPEFAVSQIFAVWARIEHELSFLLVRVLGANAAPAIAMHSTLTAQHLQLGALEAAAQAALSPDDFDVFSAAVAIAEQVQTPRNQLAHWVWAGCKQRLDLLVLANPKMLRERDMRVAKALQSAPTPLQADPSHVAEINLFNASEILAYSKSDLERALRDLREARDILEDLSDYLDPTTVQFLQRYFDEPRATREAIRGLKLDQLNERRLFREALAQRRADRQRSQQSPPESPQPAPGGS